MKPPKRISIRLAKSDHDWVLARELLLEYLEWLIEHREVTAFDDSVLKVGVDDFHREVASLPGPYGPPRGCLFLAFVDGMPAGCGALKSLGRYRAEIKRIYVRPSSRGSGLGRRITRTLVNRARALGYQRVALDTLPKMTTAIAIYRSEGFEPIPGYWPHPVPDALFFGKELRPKAPGSRRKPK